MVAFVLLVFLCVCGWKNPKTPNLSSMADDAITRGGIGPGSLVYIYGFYVVIVCSLKDEAWPLVKYYGLTLEDTKCRRECGSYSTTWNILVVYIGRISGNMNGVMFHLVLNKTIDLMSSCIYIWHIITQHQSIRPTKLLPSFSDCERQNASRLPHLEIYRPCTAKWVTLFCDQMH